MATTINPSDQTITQYNIQTGGANNLLNNVAPGATGIPVISQGVSAQPIFGTAVVAGGGTGQVTLTNHGILIGQATSAISATAAGSAGQVLQSGGASADPAYSTATYPATAGTTGSVLASNGTNFVGTLTPSVTSITVGGGTALTTFATGTFTPNLLLGGAATGMVYSIRQGSYTQIGDMVFYAVYIALTTLGSSTGNASITGFPVNCGNTNGVYYTAPVNFFFGVTCTSGYTNVSGAFVGASAQMNLTQFGTSKTGGAALSNTNMVDATTIAISGFYKTS